MVSRRVFYFFFALSSLVAPALAYCDELSDRALIREQVVNLVKEGRFETLEALADDYRKNKTRTASGLWKLTLFYAGISSAFDTNRTDEQFWNNLDKSIKEWVTTFSRSPTAHLAYTQMLLNRGWSYRGNGYAITVGPQNWEPFLDYTQRARAYLELNKGIASTDPRWYEMMAIVGYRQGWPESEFSQLITEGLGREPLFYQTYFAAIDYYAPKWGGSAEAIENFANTAVERTKSSEGFGMYARIYWYASQTQYGEDLFVDSLLDWPKMKNGINDVLSKYADSWNINNFAKFACLSGDRAKATELINRIAGIPVLEAWGNISNFNLCKSWLLDSAAKPYKTLPTPRSGGNV